MTEAWACRTGKARRGGGWAWLGGAVGGGGGGEKGGGGGARERGGNGGGGGGHEVIAQAGSAAEALAEFTERQPDLVLLDVRLNDGDGIELAGACLKVRRAAMIVISAYSDAELIRRAGEAGVFGYLIKPVEQGQLAAQVEVAVQ